MPDMIKVPLIIPTPRTNPQIRHKPIINRRFVVKSSSSQIPKPNLAAMLSPCRSPGASDSASLALGWARRVGFGVWADESSVGGGQVCLLTMSLSGCGSVN